MGPIQSLIVVNSSDATGQSVPETDQDREYEGEWIEATTTALETPSCKIGYMYEVGNRILETLGFGSYGRITMFVERSRGKISLDVGPFAGGIHASHTITVFQQGEYTCVVDRVRLQQDSEDVPLSRQYLGFLDSCLLPPLYSYMDQVKTSLARLQLLAERGDEAMS